MNEQAAVTGLTNKRVVEIVRVTWTNADSLGERPVLRDLSDDMSNVVTWCYVLYETSDVLVVAALRDRSRVQPTVREVLRIPASAVIEICPVGNALVWLT